MRTYDLISAFDLMPSFDPTTAFTRCDVKNNSYTLIDGILMSRSLTHTVTEAAISHYGNNVSDHSPVEIKLDIDLELFKPEKPIHAEYIPWSSLSDHELETFSETMENELRQINVPFHSIFHGSKTCHEVDHIHLLERYYNDVLNAIRKADSVLPRKKHGIAKHFWSEELSSLKRKSIDASALWRSAGCPKSGNVFLEKNHAHLQYKRALRKSKKESAFNISDELSHNLLTHDSNKFWQNWNRIESRNCDVSCIDGNISHRDIANAFSATFRKVYETNDVNAQASLSRDFESEYSQYRESHINDDISPYFISWSEFLGCIAKVKSGKATGNFVKPQHLLHGSPLLAIHIHLLFNAFIQHEYVPNEFLQTVVTPIIKDTTASHSDSSNYRPVTLSCLFSQLFEHAIYTKIGHLLLTDDLQFGFKPKHSTAHALFVLKETVNYFTSHGSNVFTCFLDCSKAFDKVSHKGLFLKLVKRQIPLCFLNILIYWLSNLSSQCRWRNTLSETYAITSGVKQGGILSPFLFTVFMNDLLIIIRKKGLGCHVKSMFLGAIMFADDLALITPSRYAMQELISVCDSYCKEHGLSFNAKKSKSIIFGKKFDTIVPASLTLNNEPIQYIKEWKYLGCLVVSGKEFTFSCRNELSNFRRSVNSIIASIAKPSEQVSMMMLYQFSIPILTYASEVKEFSNSDMHSCQVAVNDAVRRIFSYNRWESIRTLRSCFGYKDLYTLFALRKKSFRAKLPLMRNLAVSLLHDILE